MKRSTYVLVGLLAGLAACAGACGGVVGDSFFGGAGGTGGAGTTATSTSSGTSFLSSSTTTSSSSTTTSSSSTTTSSSSTTTSSSSTTTSSSTSSSGTTGTGLVKCNGGVCAAGQICCFNPSGPGDHCGLNGQCGAGYIELLCSGPDACPGEICCAHGMVVGVAPSQTFQYTGIACDPTCGSSIAGGAFPICDPTATPTGCAAPGVCQQSQVLGTNYYVCN